MKGILYTTLILCLLKPLSVLSQDQFGSFNNPSSDFSGSDTESEDKSSAFPVRFGGNIQGGFGFYFPTSMNNFISDYWNELCLTLSVSGESEPLPAFFGYEYQFKGLARVFDLFQLEGWYEQFYSMNIAMSLKSYSSNSYYNPDDGQIHYIETDLDSDHKFSPSYKAAGINLFFTPRAHKNKAFLTYGVGLGNYQGKFGYHLESKQTVNDNGMETQTEINGTTTFKGSKLGFNAAFGVTLTTNRYLEFEFLLHGRYVDIPELKDDNDIVFTNPWRNNEKVDLNFSGIGFKTGIKFILP